MWRYSVPAVAVLAMVLVYEGGLGNAAPPQKKGDPPRRTADSPAGPTVVATVNTQRITRDELAKECLHQYGTEVLESMVNRQLIVQECKRLNVSVTAKEVDAEVERMARRFGFSVDNMLKMVKERYNTTPTQYAHDVIWPALALRRLAGERLQVTQEELTREFETQYGAAVRARLIAVSSLEKAQSLRAQAVANPDEFGNLAKDSSEDAPSASVKGIIQPIRRHGSYQGIEEAVFNMADGEVSEVIPAGGQYVILKREGLRPARNVSFEEVAPELEETLRDRKMRAVSPEVFKRLQDNAKVENVWNDPARREKMPGVAAIVNGTQIMVCDLAQQCIERYGQETLEGMINRKLLQEACRKRNLTITDEDLDREIARQASAGVRPRNDGSPDVEAWLKLVTKKHRIPADIYRGHVVWPTVVLRRLVADQVKVTEEDLKKGYEANFGPRVRCLAIVLNDQRRAQRVFELARKNNTPEYFGELAAQYSIEPGSQSLRGEVPPIKKNGGQPILEKEAFALKPGELSGVIPVDDKFVILRCEGFTEPAQLTFASVRNEIYEDILEKKTRLAMGEFFERLQESAAIDNVLAGTSHSPNQSTAKSPAEQPQRKSPAGTPEKSLPVGIPTLRQAPGG